MSNETHQKYPRSVQHGKPRLTSLKDGWLRVPIGDLVVGVSRPVDMRDDEIYTLVTAKRSRGGIVKREVLNGKDIAVKNQFYVREDDFLISKRQIVHGACGFVPKELDGAIVSNEYLVLNFTDKIIPQFWELLSHTVYFQQVCFHSSIGVHVEKMLFKVSAWHRWEVNIPSRKEQEKIASFLGAIDTRLTQLRRKHKLLQTYKRGVMQKIFSQEVRFKGAIDSDFPDWQKKKLGKVAKFFSGGTPTSTKSAYYKGKIPFIKSGEISAEITAQFLSEEGLKSSSAQMVEVGDLLYALYGATSGEVAISKIQGAINQAVLCIRSDVHETVFLLSFLRLGKNIITGKYLQGGQGNLSAEIVKSLTVPIPCKEEQEKIADFLTAIDQKIEAVAQLIDRTERFKKGLLQKMFV